MGSVGNTRFFNLYEFLAGADKKEPTRKFYPMERTKPFWALLGLDVYISRWGEVAKKNGQSGCEYIS